MGQVAHFIGHHGKTASRFTSTRRFNGSVKRQQVGLLGNTGDHFQDLTDIHCLVVQCFDMAAGGAQQL